MTPFKNNNSYIVGREFLVVRPREILKDFHVAVCQSGRIHLIAIMNHPQMSVTVTTKYFPRVYSRRLAFNAYGHRQSPDHQHYSADQAYLEIQKYLWNPRKSPHVLFRQPDQPPYPV